ncbi:MAG: GNAT family N-acetyltransferase [Burkholderiales bacterium]|nr:GNAT family N-acetyltransferase [Burkholderiales bacterium]
MPSFTSASEADIPALSALLSVLFTQEAEFKPDEQAQQRGLAMIIRHPDVGAILVARDGTRILPMVNLLFTVSTALGERVALLEDMVVAPEARGSGIGSALLSYAIAYAKTGGIKRITLLTDQDNHTAQHFYAKQGFTTSTMIPLRLALT